ncbi:bifunctional hydroxymethylpyrimidine kinase/phosphomethylpyrimidine kinase [Streptomyces chartreusis]|uniref:bifunctional hydroxymethylpyrimidine kinase/phosphomethylpyrimidine kinase n=1 Tax=Streptomyces chartreusis TaxID=1969 RepID=UPI0037F8B806
MSSTIVCLSVGSSDSSGGAGIQGDVKACSAMGAYCATAVVGVTAQNTRGVTARWEVPVGMIADQITAVMDDIRIHAIKVGTVWSAEIMNLLADRFAGLDVPIVFDPVLKTSSGSFFTADSQALEAARQRMLEVATVVTPNLAEAQILADAADVSLPSALAELVSARGARAVLITDVVPAQSCDWLYDGKRHRPIITAQRHGTGCEHGAGCAHSTILAVLLAQGHSLFSAAALAHQGAAAAVRYGAASVGTHDHPVDVCAGLAHLPEG